MIFIAGPYSNDTPERVVHNVERAIRTGVTLMERGHPVIIPHLSHYVDAYLRDTGVVKRYEWWLDWTLSLVERCDALFYIAPSPGSDREAARAKELGKFIYFTLDDVPVSAWPARQPVHPVQHTVVPVSFRP